MADVEDEPQDNAVHYVVPDLQPGDRCCIQPGDRMGKVMFIGPVNGMPGGYWVGVQYDDKVGKNDGTFNGRRFFTCPPGHGGFLRPSKVAALDAVKRKKEAEEAEEAAKEAARKGKAGQASPGGKGEKKGKNASDTSQREGADAVAEAPATAAVSAEVDAGGSAGAIGAAAAGGSSIAGSNAAGGGVAKSVTARGRSNSFGHRPRSSRSPSTERERRPEETHPEHCVVSGSGITSAVVGAVSIEHGALSSYAT